MTSISVIIPTYNCGVFIDEAISSVMAQSMPADEVIIVDDGSTDDTQEIIARLRFNNVRYFYQKNSGVSAARNLGLSNATGKYIAFLDADDRWRPSMLEEQSQTLESHPDVALCVTNFIRFVHLTGEKLSDQFSFYPEIKKIRKKRTANEASFIVDHDAFIALVEFNEPPSFTSAIMFRATSLQGLSFNSHLKICEDLEFVLKVATRGMVGFNSNILMEMRRHGANATSDYSNISINKLDALVSFKNSTNLNKEQQHALNYRLIKAFVAAAITSARTGNPSQAFRYYIQALSIRDFRYRKFKGLCRVLWEIAKQKIVHA